MAAATTKNSQLAWSKPRTLKKSILEAGCAEYRELVDLLTEGYRDSLLKRELKAHFSRRRQDADESTAQDDEYWLPVMSSALGHIDKKVNCIPRNGAIRFLDLGCCPGGFSDYILCQNPQAQGVGVSLEKESGGHGLAIPLPQRDRFEMHWADLTYLSICSPLSTAYAQSSLSKSGRVVALAQLPFTPRDFQLVLLDGQHRRPQESTSTHPWDIDRLLVAQLIIALESLGLGGTLIVKLSHLESSTTARFVYMLDKLSRTVVAFKPYVHATRGSFYAVAGGVGLGSEGSKIASHLEHLKEVWRELTYGGSEGSGRWLKEEDLDFIVDFDTLKGPYLRRLIVLGRGAWQAQGNALRRTYSRIREAAAQRNPYPTRPTM